MTTETQSHSRRNAIVVCSRCSWAYFPTDWPLGPGPIIALQEHFAAQHQRCPYCGAVMVGRVCRRCDARSEDSPGQVGEGAAALEDEGMTANYDELRSWARCMSSLLPHYKYAQQALALLDENAELRAAQSALKGIIRAIDAHHPKFKYGPFTLTREEIEAARKALGDAS